MSVCCSPELYFVKVDVKACFDTIKQDKLLGLVEEILSDVSAELATQLLSSYWHSRLIDRRSTTFKSTRKLSHILGRQRDNSNDKLVEMVSFSFRSVMRLWLIDTVITADDLGSFKELAMQLAEDLHDVVLTDQVSLSLSGPPVNIADCFVS